MVSSTSAPINPVIANFREEINLPANCFLDFLTEGCENWETDSKNLPAGSIVLGELHLRILRFPLHPLIHYICTLCDLHPMQLAPNAIRQIMGFISLNTIAKLQMTFEDFWFIYGLTKSVGSLHVDRYTLSPRKPFSLFQGLPTSDKDWATKQKFVLSGNWQAPAIDRAAFAIRTTLNFGTIPVTQTLPIHSLLRKIC